MCGLIKHLVKSVIVCQCSCAFTFVISLICRLITKSSAVSCLCYSTLPSLKRVLRKRPYHNNNPHFSCQLLKSEADLLMSKFSRWALWQSWWLWFQDLKHWNVTVRLWAQDFYRASSSTTCITHTGRVRLIYFLYRNCISWSEVELDNNNIKRSHHLRIIDNFKA